MTKVNDSTTKELIEQEAESRYQFKTSGYLPERSFFNNEQSNKISGFIDGATFALSLPKQDNGDAWDEVIWHAEQLIKDLDGVFIGAIARSTLDKLKTSISKIK